MPNPGTFTGLRGDFLKEQRELYAHAVKDGNINDVVTDIQRRYFKRFPITLPHEEEPTQAWLDQVDDDAPDAEIEPPNVDGMSPDDASKALKEHSDLMKKLKDRKDSIKRRLHYMYSKENDAKPSTKPGTSTDIVSALTARILGIDAKLPRLKTAYNVWGPQHREVVDPVFNKRVEDGDVPASQQIALRSAVYKELFDKLPEDERELWAKAAIREHEKAVRGIKHSMAQGGSRAPQDRQRVITALPGILEPILDLLADYTGWKFSAIAGGPEPADGGRLNMIMIHSGVVPGTVKVDFGSHQHEAFKKSITPSFGSFLKKCYSIDECRSRALPEGFDIRSLADVDAEEELDLYTFEIDKEHVEVSKSHKAKRLLEKEVRKHRKSAKPTPPPTGTPSPPVRFGPPIGKKKIRELPSKDKPSNPPRPQQSSPLASGSITAPAINGAMQHATQTSSESDESIFCQGFDVPDIGELPEKRVLTVEEASALSEAVAGALRGYVSTASRSDPPTPAPSRDPFAAQPPTADKSLTRPSTPPPTEQDTAVSPLTAPNSPPPSLPVSRPATPPLNSSKFGAGTAPLPVRPGTLPPRDATPSLHPTTPPSRHATLSLRSTRTPSRLATPPSCSMTTTSPGEILAQSDATSQAAPQVPTPSGAVTVPEFPPVDSNTTNNKKRTTRNASGSTEKRKAPTQNGGMPKKKQRTSSGTSASTPFEPAFPLDLPSDCPDWLRNALDLLTRKDLGSTWRELVSAWLRFEENSGIIEHAGRLGSQGRPQVMADWIKSARPAHRTPELGNLGRFEAGFVSWWNSVQPDWRNAGVDSEVGGGRSGDDWSDLEGCHGVNGLLTIVAALFFWGLAASTEEEVRQWGTAAADVLYVLQQLA